MSKVLITGISGYIGQHLALALRLTGWHVRGLSRTACPPHLQGIEWLHGDITNRESVAAAVTGCTDVVHLACLPLGESAHNPVEAMRINGVATLTLLEAAQRATIQTFVYASTGQVYGGQAPLPNHETTAPQPDSPYAASKLCGETWCSAYAQTTAMQVQRLRLFNVYGPAADGSLRPTVESIFLRLLKQGEAPVVRGHREDGRDFVHVEDVVRAIQCALACRTGSHLVNVGTGVCTSLHELAMMAAQVVGSPLKPQHDNQARRPMRFCAATLHAQTTLGFQAAIPLWAGLQNLVERL